MKFKKNQTDLKNYGGNSKNSFYKEEDLTESRRNLHLEMNENLKRATSAIPTPRNSKLTKKTFVNDNIFDNVIQNKNIKNMNIRKAEKIELQKKNVI